MNQLEWRGTFANEEVESLHAKGFGRDPVEYDWWGQVNDHSLGWVTARRNDSLIGFVNVVWDGYTHAFVLDTVVIASERSHGIGRELVARAVEHSRAAGCEWIHVDFDEHLTHFYLDVCGFRQTPAGVIAL